MMMAKLGLNPKYQFLSAIANQIGQAQMTALTGKKDATSAQISLQLTQLSSALQSQTVQASSQGLKSAPSTFSQSAHASHKLNSSSFTHDAQSSNITNDSNGDRLGAADPDAGSNSGGYGSSNPNSNEPTASHGSGYGDYSNNNTQSSQGPSGPGSDPSSWNPQSMRSNVLAYDRMMFHYFDMLQSSQMNNPQDIIAFVTALSKLAQVQNAPLPSGKSYAPHFQAFLNSLSNNFTVKIDGSSMLFGNALARALAIAALYNQNQTGQDAQGFLNKILGQLGSTPGFLGTMASYLQSGVALNKVKQSSVYSNMQNDSDGGKQLVSNIVEQIGYGIQGSFGQIRQSYMSSYEDSISQQLDRLQAGGASIYEMMNLVLMSYDQSDDYAASYSIPISDLGNAGNAGATMMQFLTPTGLTTADDRSSSPYCIHGGQLSPSQVNQANSFFQTYTDLNQEWGNTPSLQQSGVTSSINYAVTKIGSTPLAPLDWLTTSAFTPTEVSKLKTMFGSSGHMSDLMKAMQKDTNPSDQTLMKKYLISSLDYMNSTTVDPKTGVPSPNASTQAAINSLQTLQSQISSVNQSAKAEFTNANQSAANLLSTVGGIEKNVVGMLNNIVQAQKF